MSATTPKKGGAVFDRLYNSPTTASVQQQYSVWKAKEKEQTKPAAKPVKRNSPMKSPLPRVAQLSNASEAPTHHNHTKFATKKTTTTPTRKKKTSPTKSPTRTVPAKKTTKSTKAPSSEPSTKKTEQANGTVPDAVMHIQIPPKEEGMKLFRRLDPNGNGLLSLAELDKGVIELFPNFNNKPAIMRAYKAADKSGDGFVTRNEFGYFLRFLQYYNNLWSLFEAIDTTGDRRITEQEFVDNAVLLNLGDVDPAAVFAEIDENQGGFLLFDELCHWMAVNKSDWGDDEHIDKPPPPEQSSKAIEAPASASTSSTTKKPPKKQEEVVVPDVVMNIQIPPKEEGMKLFSRLDPNGNGLLSLAELDKGVIELFPNFNNKPAIMRAYKAADKSGDGFVTRREFGYFLRFLQYYNNLWSLFEAIDTTGDRRITEQEFVDNAGLLKLGDADPATVFAEIDENKGGFVLFDELCHWMAVNQSDWGDDEHIDKNPPPEQSSKAIEAPASTSTSSTTKATEAPKQQEEVVVPDAVMHIQIPPKEEGMKLFSRLDPNGNGLLSLAELDKGVIELFPNFNNKPAIMRAYKAADKSGDGFVTRREFGYFLRFLQYYNNLWSLFEAIDTTGDRRITEQEFVDNAGLLNLGDADPATVFAEIDENKGGFVLFDELCHWMAVNKSDWGDDEHIDANQAAAARNSAASTAAPENHKPAEPAAPIPAEAMKFEVPPKEEAIKLFDAWDPNGNGLLSLAELDKGILEMKPEFNNKPAIMRAYKASDRNGDGFVKRSEFYFFLKFIQYYHHLWEIFRSMDTSDDRRITLEEFSKAYPAIDPQADPAAVFAEIDTNGGGYILFDEFCAWKAKQD